MDNNSITSDTCISPACRGRECNNSTGQSSVSVKDGRTNKRKASPHEETQRKKSRVSEPGLPKTSEEDTTLRGMKRKSRGDIEGPSVQEKRIRTEPLEVDTVSTSLDTGRETLHTCGKEGPKKNMALKGARRTKEKSKQGIFFSQVSANFQRARFEAKYQQQNQLGKGGCGTVFAGFRKKDDLPVAIKHIPKENVLCKHVDKSGKEIPMEVIIMLELRARANGSVGTSVPVSLLDWYDLGQEQILVLERPVPAKDLYDFIVSTDGPTIEEEAKIILRQLVDAAIDLQNQKIFHRDLKLENILIECCSNFPRVRLIDFGLSCFAERWSSYRTFYGTPEHAPPEWFRTGHYSARPTTVWQLGVVTFETLHKDDTFETEDFLEKGLEIRPELSENCRDFLSACLDKDPQKRHTLEQLRLHPWLRKNEATLAHI